MLRPTVYVFFLVGLLLAGCSTSNGTTIPTPEQPPEATPSQAPDLEGAEWVLEALGLQVEPQAALAGTRVTASFDPAAGIVSGQTGCNDYSATYQTESERMLLGPVGATRKACGEMLGMQQMEMVFIDILENTATYQITDGKLILLTADGRVLIFSKP